MDLAQRITAETREAAYRARSQRARGLARLVLWAAAAVFLTAAWQDRALAPPVHDGMVTVRDNVLYAINNSDSVRDYLKRTFSSPSGTSAQAEFDPITRWLLKWRN